METVIFSGILAGLLQVFKKAFDIKSKYIPLTNLIISLVIMSLSLLLSKTSLSWDAIVQAITVSLVASGLYSTTKSTIKN